MDDDDFTSQRFDMLQFDTVDEKMLGIQIRVAHAVLRQDAERLRVNFGRDPALLHAAIDELKHARDELEREAKTMKAALAQLGAVADTVSVPSCGSSGSDTD